MGLLLYSRTEDRTLSEQPLYIWNAFPTTLLDSFVYYPNISELKNITKHKHNKLKSESNKPKSTRSSIFTRQWVDQFLHFWKTLRVSFLCKKLFDMFCVWDVATPPRYISPALAILKMAIKKLCMSGSAENLNITLVSAGCTQLFLRSELVPSTFHMCRIWGNAAAFCKILLYFRVPPF